MDESREWSHTDITGFKSLSDMSITSYVTFGKCLLVNEMKITLESVVWIKLDNI